MPKIDIVFYKEDDGKIPMEIWLDSLPKKIIVKCEKRLELLAESGHFLRRPIAAYLRDGIYELRIRHQNVNYRMLCFFHGNQVVVISHGFTKERIVPPKEIKIAKQRKVEFERNPLQHTYSPLGKGGRGI